MGDREGSGRGGRGTGVNPLKRDWRGEEEMGFAERKGGFGKGENEPRRSEAEEGRHWRSKREVRSSRMVSKVLRSDL